MKISKEIAFISALFVLLLLALLSSNYWHSFTVKQESVSFSLREFGLMAEKGKNACFSLAISPSNLEEPREIEISASLNGNNVLEDSVEVQHAEETRKYCFAAAGLGKKNLVEVFAEEEKLFYHLHRGEIPRETPAVAIEKVEKNTVNLYITNFSLAQYTPLEIYVNGKLDHRVYPTQKEQRFEEKISLAPGNNSIRAEFMGKADEKEFVLNEPFSMNPAIGLLVFVFGLFVFMAFVFSEREMIEKAALSFFALSILFIADVLFLEFFGLLSAATFTAAILIDLIIILLIFRKKFSLPAFALKKEKIPFIVFIAVFLVVFSGLAVHLFTPSYFTYFNVYYERQSNFIAQNGFVPGTDSLSYLGRNFSFIPGYFLIESGISLLTGTDGRTLFALSLAIANVFLLLSALFFARTLKFSKANSFLFFVFLSMSTFIFSMLTVTPRHSIALSFLFVALSILIKYKKPLLTGAALALAGFIQIPVILWFAFLAPAVQKKVEWRPFLTAFVIGLAAFAVLYLPTLMANGLPAQSRPADWGYLIQLPIFYVLSDLGILLIVFISFIAMRSFSMFQKKEKPDGLGKKLFIAAAISILIQAFISSRWNLVSSVTIALFLTHSIARNGKKPLSEFYFALGAIVLLGLYIAFLSFPSYTLTEQVTAPMQFLRENSSTQEYILADPFYGHAIALVSERGTLSDLCVEYADEKKLSDSYEFLKTGNSALLEKYSLGTVFSHRKIINEKVVDNEPAPADIEFGELEKIYANEQFFVHRKIS